jgi:hypothetical protein
MKNIFIFCILFLTGTSAFAQFFNSSHVPEGIKENLKAQFPHARKLEWSKDGDAFQAAFNSHNKRVYVLYNPDGSEIAQVTEIHKAKLPHNIRRTLRKNYNTFNLVGANVIQTGNEKGFEAEVMKAEEAYNLIFNERGWLMSVEPVDPPAEDQ